METVLLRTVEKNNSFTDRQINIAVSLNVYKDKCHKRSEEKSAVSPNHQFYLMGSWKPTVSLNRQFH